MTDITTISIISGITIAIIKVLDKGMDFVIKQFSKSNKDGKQEVEIAVIAEKLHKIETNDLYHIGLALKDNAKDHKDIFIGVTEIKTIQNIILDKLKELHK